MSDSSNIKYQSVLKKNVEIEQQEVPQINVQPSCCPNNPSCILFNESLYDVIPVDMEYVDVNPFEIKQIKLTNHQFEFESKLLL